jgi:predicted RNase H-like HicB family nuclease
MEQAFTLEYWEDGKWFVGRLVEIPGIFSQGETIEELEENIQEVYELMKQESKFTLSCKTQLKKIGVKV